MCYLSWMVGHFQRYQRYHKVIFIYADLDHQGPYCDHQDFLCDQKFYADMDHPDHCCYVRLYTDHCLKVIFIYADLDHQDFLCDHESYVDLDHQGPYCDYTRAHEMYPKLT